MANGKEKKIHVILQIRKASDFVLVPIFFLENKQEFVCFCLLESYCVSNMIYDLSVSLLVLLTYLVIYVRIKSWCFMEFGRVEIVQCLAEISYQLLSKWRAVNLNLFSRSHTLHIFYGSCEMYLIQ